MVPKNVTITNHGKHWEKRFSPLLPNTGNIQRDRLAQAEHQRLHWITELCRSSQVMSGCYAPHQWFTCC